MSINDNVREAAVKEFLKIHDELQADQRFADREELIPFAALANVLSADIEKIGQRTEIECKKEVYLALDKQPPSTKQLLRQ